MWNVRELIVNVIAEAGGVDDSERDADAIFLELCRGHAQTPNG